MPRATATYRSEDIIVEFRAGSGPRKHRRPSRLGAAPILCTLEADQVSGKNLQSSEAGKCKKEYEAHYLGNHSEFLTAALSPSALDPACVILSASLVRQDNEQDAGICSPLGNDVSQLLDHQLEYDTSKEVAAHMSSRSVIIEDDIADESSPTETVATSPGTMESAATTPDTPPIHGQSTPEGSRPYLYEFKPTPRGSGEIVLGSANVGTI
ncbi:hypothetical protein CSAL01_06546 [Colletotrichum salicis]|uniref:Uncharacterized protein n=1 Tax=Colletotrichum salicis TaxID=1209931 RepID=A0A135V3H5_9PEZI|nr:hypothetical protein CSAL01_06546 [Colletotrichum salicis]